MHGLGVVAVGAVGDGEAVLVERQQRLVLGAVDGELGDVAGAAEHRDGDLAVHTVVGCEVDVEVGGELRVTTAPQNVPPPRVLSWILHPDVVGNDVDDDPHAHLGSPRVQASQCISPAEGGGDGRGVGDVVPVRRTVGRGQYR
ncbi:unannotated protein [freshwater metagenome]|uniref:Unannotated protein n=1 Tax=freshwater metagenome TaxID=449393 RepID=A0A6J7GDV5_9ZZZZ